MTMSEREREINIEETLVSLSFTHCDDSEWWYENRLSSACSSYYGSARWNDFILRTKFWTLAPLFLKLRPNLFFLPLLMTGEH